MVTADMASAISTDYSCSINTEGPCGQASAVISVKVFNFGKYLCSKTHSQYSGIYT